MSTPYVELYFCLHCLFIFVYESVTLSVCIFTHPPSQPAVMYPAMHQTSITLHMRATKIIQWPFGLQKALNSKELLMEKQNLNLQWVWYGPCYKDVTASGTPRRASMWLKFAQVEVCKVLKWEGNTASGDSKHNFQNTDM